jgi:hypothetical protein
VKAAPGSHRQFLRRLPIALLAAMALWVLARPALDAVVTGIAEVLVRAYEYPRVTRLVVDDHRVQVRRSDFRTDSKIPTLPLTEVHFNTIVLLALSLALARPFARRQLERLVMGWSVLLLSQALNLVFHVKTLYALGLGEWSHAHYSDLARNLYGFAQYFTDLPGRFSFPFLIWLAFNWELILTMIGNEPSTAKPPRTSKERRRKA